MPISACITVAGRWDPGTGEKQIETDTDLAIAVSAGYPSQATKVARVVEVSQCSTGSVAADSPALTT